MWSVKRRVARPCTKKRVSNNAEWIRSGFYTFLELAPYPIFWDLFPQTVVLIFLLSQSLRHFGGVGPPVQHHRSVHLLRHVQPITKSSPLHHLFSPHHPEPHLTPSLPNQSTVFFSYLCFQLAVVFYTSNTAPYDLCAASPSVCLPVCFTLRVWACDQLEPCILCGLCSGYKIYNHAPLTHLIIFNGRSYFNTFGSVFIACV